MPAMRLKAKHTYRVTFDWMYPDYTYNYGMPFGFGLTKQPLGDAPEAKNVVPLTLFMAVPNISMHSATTRSSRPNSALMKPEHISR